MPAIHVLGSSHVSYHHGLPTAICELYDIMEEAFKNRFYLSTAKGVSGGRIANIRLTNEFVSVAEETAKESGYDGQVVCLLLGTNDWARPEMTEINFESQYKKLVDRFIAIPKTAVVLTGLIPREAASDGAVKRTDMRIPTKIVRVLAGTYLKEGKKVRFVPVHNLILESGSGDNKEDRAVKKGRLTDGVHMTEAAVVEVAKSLLFAIKKMPKAWFSD